MGAVCSYNSHYGTLSCNRALLFETGLWVVDIDHVHPKLIHSER